MWPLAIGAAAGIAAAGGAPMDPGLLAFLQSLTPTAADLGIKVLDGNTGDLATLAPGVVQDVPGIEESTTTTWEVGYQAILGGRFKLALDLWHTTRRDFVSPLILATPLLLLDGAGVGNFVAGPWIADRVGALVADGMDAAAALAQAEAEAAVAVPAIATALGSIPVGVVASPDLDASAAEVVATFVNVGEVELSGMDLAFQWFIDEHWTLQGAASLVSDDWFEVDGAAPIALNAPSKKGSLGLTWRGDSAEVGGRIRSASSFPASSAGLVGTECVTGGNGGVFEESCVEGSTLFDLSARFSIPNTGASLDVTVSDVFDAGYRSFVGVPSIGRFAVVGVRWSTGR
jgi:outer membrane receptor protein involved in Fe transport